jgi:hypothetical protein
MIILDNFYSITKFKQLKKHIKNSKYPIHLKLKFSRLLELGLQQKMEGELIYQKKRINSRLWFEKFSENKELIYTNFFYTVNYFPLAYFRNDPNIIKKIIPLSAAIFCQKECKNYCYHENLSLLEKNKVFSKEQLLSLKKIIYVRQGKKEKIIQQDWKHFFQVLETISIKILGNKSKVNFDTSIRIFFLKNIDYFLKNYLENILRNRTIFQSTFISDNFYLSRKLASAKNKNNSRAFFKKKKKYKHKQKELFSYHK